LHINVQQATSQLAAKYREQLTLHESNTILHPFPTKLPSLSRADYPQIVGGSKLEPILLPAFRNAFSKENNLWAWRHCGAVPLTRAALQNPMVRHVLTPEDMSRENEDSEVSFVGRVDDFDWKNATLIDLERENQAACDKLDSFGIDSSVLRLKAPRQAAALTRSRLPADTTEEE
jgi:hypothetical protein